MKAMKALVKQAARRAGVRLERIVDPRFPGDPFEEQRELLSRLDRAVETILDVGAYQGETVARYRGLFPGATVHAFEPFPDSFRALEERFGDDPKVRLYNVAVADAPGERTFHVNALAATNSLLPRPEGGKRYYPDAARPEGTIEVEVTTLDAILAREGIERVDALKLDIQGGELLALAGAANALAAGRIALIQSECMFVPHYAGGPLLHELWSALAGHRFTLFALYDLLRAANGQLRFGDAVFVHDQLRQAVLDRFA